MKKTLFLLTLISVLALLLSGAAVAATQAAGDDGCPDDFHIHPIHHHDHEGHDHHHAGSDKDKNDDGLLCVKHVGADGSVHVHRDNKLDKE